jgi:hypothetical protein
MAAVIRTPPARVRRSAVATAVALALLGIALIVVSHRTPAVPGPPDRPPRLSELWSGGASLVLDRRWTSTSLGQPQGGAYAGSKVEVSDGHWFLFNRYPQPAPGCPGGVALGTQVRASPDGGRTWGPPVPAVAPTPGTPWACAATDGDAVWDAPAGTWRFLFQCMGAKGGWNGCYAERHDPSPVGPFAAAADENPVITRGSLWSRICADTGDVCHDRPIIDVGTFSLLPAPTGGWWVGFHGFDGTHGYRGIVRTWSFRRGAFSLNGADGTPTDAAITAADAAGWREQWAPGGPIGPGAAGMIEDGGWYYQLAELPDKSLGCTPGQHWDLGLFRARTAASRHWDQLPATNPIVYSSEATGPSGESAACNVEYPGLFEDDATGRLYLSYGRISSDPNGDAIFVYRLEWNRNVLANGDFWRADAEAWHAWPGTSTQLAAQRLPDGSPDGTPWLAFNCGGTCGPDSGIYQDARVPSRVRGRPVAFGGTVRTQAGPAPLDIVLFQFDAHGATIRSDVLRATADGAYRTVRGTSEIDSRAQTLRFQLFPHSSAQYAADDLYVIPQDGCHGARYPAC